MILFKCKQSALTLTYHYYSIETTPWAPGEKSTAELLGHSYRDLLPNLQVSANVAYDTDQDLIQQNHLQMQKKHNARLGPKITNL